MRIVTAGVDLSSQTSGPRWQWGMRTEDYAVAFTVIACSVRTVVSMSSRSNWLSNCAEGPPMNSRRL